MNGYDMAKENHYHADKSDEEIAIAVRMLMRGDLDHEHVCTMARNRIMWLSGQLAAHDLAKRNEGLEAALDDAVDQVEEARCYIIGILNDSHAPHEVIGPISNDLIGRKNAIRALKVQEGGEG